MNVLMRDVVPHILTLYDLIYWREKTVLFLAFDDGGLLGYTLIFDGSHVHVRGDVSCVANLLSLVNLSEARLVFESSHLSVVKRFYRPVGSLAPEGTGLLTRFLGMVVDRETFKRSITHEVRRLVESDLEDVKSRFGERYWRIALEALRTGFSYIAFHGRHPASIGSIHLVGDFALIRGVYTIPEFRGLGLATSVCSALVEEALRLCKFCILWVDRDNFAARRVYEKLGFKLTGHVLLGFKGRRIR